MCGRIDDSKQTQKVVKPELSESCQLWVIFVCFIRGSRGFRFCLGLGMNRIVADSSVRLWLFTRMLCIVCSLCVLCAKFDCFNIVFIIYTAGVCGVCPWPV